MNEFETFKEKFNIQDYTIYETDHWIWSLRPLQGTVGAGVLSLKRPCPVLSEVLKDEFADLDQMIKVIEGTLKRTFNYDIMNYLMLMMVDKQVHYHVFPRYEHNVSLGNKSYTDQNWPKPPELAGEPLSDQEMTEIFTEIKKNIGAFK